MRYQVWILTTDALFGRMLQLEFEGWHLTAGLSERMEPTDWAEVAVTDLDSTSVPPEGSYGYLIGFSRLPALSADEDARRCAMILRRPFRVSLLRQEAISRIGWGTLPERDPAPHRPALRMTGDGLQYGEWTVALTPTERRLAEMLLEAKGEPVPYAALERGLLTPDRGKLAVYLCTMRKKMRAGGLPAVPEPVRGVGYRLIFSEKS